MTGNFPSVCADCSGSARVFRTHTCFYFNFLPPPTPPSHHARFLHGRCVHECVRAFMDLGNYLTFCVISSGTASSAVPAPAILDARCQQEERLEITAAHFCLSFLHASDTSVQGCVLKAVSNEVKPTLAPCILHTQKMVCVLDSLGFS